MALHEAVASYEWIVRGQPLFHSEDHAFPVLIWAHQTQTDATKKRNTSKHCRRRWDTFWGPTLLGAHS